MIFLVLILVSCSGKKITDTFQERKGLKYVANEVKPYAGTQITFWDGSEQKKEEKNYKGDGKK